MVSIQNVIVELIILSSLGLPLLWYMIPRWRQTCTFFTFAFLLTETVVLVVGFINMFILIEGTRKYIQKEKPIDSSLISESEKIWYFFSLVDRLPSIMILVPTYKEGTVVLERTLLAIQSIDYPKHLLTVVVGDDGNNDNTRDFIMKKFPEINYHRRKKIFSFAKAGNINDILFNGIESDYENLKNIQEIEELAIYKGEFVLILDCDMAPIPNILSNLLPLFYDSKTFEKNEKCCFIQSPQQFCNIRGIDFMGQNYNFFYKVVLRAYSGYDLGVPCCGTNVLFDRFHLTKIGGIQYGSITEDFNTSLTFHSLHLHSKFYPKTTAIGFAPITIIDFQNQRERWSIGGLQIVFSKTYWPRFRKLPAIYKWIYTFSGVSPILSFFMMILICGPILDLLEKKIFLCGMTDDDYLRHFLPYAIVYMGYLLLLHRGLSWPVLLLSMQESIFLIPFYVKFFISFIFYKLNIQDFTFKITPKNVSYSNYADHCLGTFFIILPYLLYFLLITISLTLAMENKDFLRVDVAWLVFICVQLLNPILFIIQSFIFS